MSVQFCSRCGKPLWVDEHGEWRCPNAHAQPTEAKLLDALTQLVPVLLDVRNSIEATREDARAEQPPRAVVDPGDEWVDLREMARRLGRSEDWLREHARELGGRQRVKRGRWLFHPPLTMSLFGQTDAPGPSPLPAPTRPRSLSDRVPLLPVKDRAA
jgi:hypothetical protein